MSMFSKISWILQTVRREIVGNKGSALRLVLAVALGTAGSIGVNSYKQNLLKSIHSESRNLIGADLIVESVERISGEKEKFLSEKIPAGAVYKRNVIFNSMLGNSDYSETVLSTVKAAEKGYPLYGSIHTDPPNAYYELSQEEILLDEKLAENLKLKIGDEVNLGNSVFILAGFIKAEPATIGNFSSMSPSSLFQYEALEETGLESRGSRIRYYAYISLPDTVSAKKFKEMHFKDFAEKDLILYENTEVGSGSQKFIESTFDFLSLLGYFAFFIGAISIYLTARERIESKNIETAVLKCLGYGNGILISSFAAEFLILSVLGIIPGILTAYYFQFLIPDITGSDLLAKIKPALTLESVILGILSGIVIPAVVSTESAWNFYRQKPAAILKGGALAGVRRPGLSSALYYLFLAFCFFGIAYIQSRDWIKAMILCVSLLALPVLILISYFLLKLIHDKIFHKGMQNSADIGLLNFFRPGAGDLLKIVGAASAVILLLLTYTVKENLLNLGGWNFKGKKANVFVTDLKTDQKDALDSALKNLPHEVRYDMPVSGARLVKINGLPVKKDSMESDSRKRDWRSLARSREYFLTYREKLYDTEELAEGKFWRNEGYPEVSIEKDFAKALKVNLGDELTFNVQGTEISGKFTNTRIVNWADMKPNVVVLFSPGVLEGAPSYIISSMYIPDNEKRYQFQKELIRLCPNVSVYDAEKTLSRVNVLIERVAGIAELMTGLILACSLLLLTSALFLQLKEKIVSFALLKVSGAGDGFLKKVILTEAALFSFFTFFTALVLSSVSCWIFTEYFLKINFSFPFFRILLFGTVYLFTIIIFYILSMRRAVVSNPKSVFRM